MLLLLRMWRRSPAANHPLIRLSTLVVSVTVPRYLDTEDLIDAQGVAELLGLAQRNTVSAYQRRYPAMPRPVVNLGQGRCKLWLRSEIESWRADRLANAGR